MANKKLYKKERFSGCIVGAAAGDALGSPVKTLTISQIKDLYGKKGILKLSPEKRQKTARISDETQMMLFTAHGILWADAAGLRSELCGLCFPCASAVALFADRRYFFNRPAVDT